MERVIQLKRPQAGAPRAAGDDVAYPEELVEIFLVEFTETGDLVFDPFAGFGTTLVVAERMNRRALGIELLPERVESIRPRLSDSLAIIKGDALRMAELRLPRIDFVMTSPPYMTKVNHPQNPLTGYQTLDGDYDRYLAQIGSIFDSIATLMSAGNHVVLNVADIRTPDGVTGLPHDITQALRDVLTLEEQILIAGETADTTIEANYCLVFRT